MKFEEAEEIEYDYKESLLPPEEQRELNELRRLRFERPLNEDQRKKLMELEAKEEKIRTTGKPGLTNEEEQEYLELTRKQTGSKGWTPEDWEKLRELEKRR